MASPPPPEHAAAPPARAGQPARTRLHWSLWTALLLVVGLAATVAGTAWWLWRTDSGLATVARLLPKLTGGVVSAEGAEGSLAHGFRLGSLHVRAGTTDITVTRLQARLRNADFGLRLGALLFDFEELAADQVRVRIVPSTQPTPPPQSIGSPVPVIARRLAIGQLVLLTGPGPAPSELVFSNVAGDLRIGPEGYSVEQAQLAVGPASAPLQL